MEFSVFLSNQDHITDNPLHRGTRTVVALVLAAGYAARIGQNAIKLTTPEDWTWKDVKLRARNPRQIISQPHRCYEHHIEPKILRLTIANSEWEMYMAGLDSGRGMD